MIIGLTGGIGTGKSTVSGLLKEIGAKVIDVDWVYHGLLKPGSAVWQGILRSFGPKYFKTDGTLNRKLLGSEVFGDPEKLRLLENLTHPAIHEKISALVLEARREEEDTVLDHPLLFEMKMTSYVDQVWIVTCPKTVQISRICARNGISPEEAEQRIRAQLPIEFKISEADVVLDNSGSLAELKDMIIKLWKERRK